MTEIIFAIVVVSAIGLTCGLILAVASKFMEVKEDSRITEVRECLPGANCGACGFTGCDGYAKALIESEGTATNLCTPGGSEVAKKIAEKLGVEFADTEKAVAYVHCHGDCSATKVKYSYEGISTCAGAKMLFSGNWACPHSCIGLGDCALVCPSDAILIRDGIAHIDPHKCTGCGLCSKTCPNSLITLYPAGKHIVVACHSTDKGAVTRNICTNGCIGCKKCEKTCPSGAISVKDNLARIDNEKCTDCELCVEACPIGCIKVADFR